MEKFKLIKVRNMSTDELVHATDRMHSILETKSDDKETLLTILMKTLKVVGEFVETEESDAIVRSHLDREDAATSVPTVTSNADVEIEVRSFITARSRMKQPASFGAICEVSSGTPAQVMSAITSMRAEGIIQADIRADDESVDEWKKLKAKLRRK